MAQFELKEITEKPWPLRRHKSTTSFMLLTAGAFSVNFNTFTRDLNLFLCPC